MVSTTGQVRLRIDPGCGRSNILHHRTIWLDFINEPSEGKPFESIVHVRPPGSAAMTSLGRPAEYNRFSEIPLMDCAAENSANARNPGRSRRFPTRRRTAVSNSVRVTDLRRF